MSPGPTAHALHLQMFGGNVPVLLCTTIGCHGRRMNPAAYSHRSRSQRILSDRPDAWMRIALCVQGQRY